MSPSPRLTARSFFLDGITKKTTRQLLFLGFDTTTLRPQKAGTMQLGFQMPRWIGQAAGHTYCMQHALFPQFRNPGQARTTQQYNNTITAHRPAATN
jgi:hypothetical protein